MFNIGIVVIVVLFCFAIKKLYYKVVIVLWIVCYSCKQLLNRDDQEYILCNIRLGSRRFMNLGVLITIQKKKKMGGGYQVVYNSFNNYYVVSIVLIVLYYLGLFFYSRWCIR